MCIVCDKSIATACTACGVIRKSGDYTEVLIPWTNGSRMTMAVCVECAKQKVWKADKVEMTKAVWAAWDKKGGIYDKGIVIGDAL